MSDDTPVRQYAPPRDVTPNHARSQISIGTNLISIGADHR